MRQLNNIFDIQQVTKDLQDQAKKTAISAVQHQINTINPSKFFISSETGKNNAIAGGLPIFLAPGIIVTVLLAHTLAGAGANTFNNSAIKSHFNPANNIATGYAVGGIIQLCWTGSIWLDLSQ